MTASGGYCYAGPFLQYVGTWVSGRREGGGELVLGNYSYQGGFTNDLVSAGRLVWGEGHV